MDKETLLFLLKEGHMDMSNRIGKGLWPHPPLHLKDCVIVIIEALEQDKYFPYCWIDKQDGELIDDIAVIEKINCEKFVFHYREASPSNLRKISIREEKNFKTSQAAAEYYLRKVLRLPGDLDGWKVVE